MVTKMISSHRVFVPSVVLKLECRFHLVSHNVGVVQPFEALTVIKGYANKHNL